MNRNFFAIITLLMSLYMAASAGTPESNFERNKLQLMKKFSGCEYESAQTSILSAGDPCKPSQKFICIAAARCATLGDDKKAITAHVNGICFAPNRLCPNDPLDCFAAASFEIGARGDAAVGDANFPHKTTVPEGTAK